jgi:hypothetical protein
MHAKLSVATILRIGLSLFIIACLFPLQASKPSVIDKKPWIETRGIYGGIPTELFQAGKSLRDYGINAIFIGSGGISSERIELVHSQGARLFAEFNSMHAAEFLKDHPDASPVGADGQIAPPPDGWQGICPTHPGYRRNRMDTYEKLLRDFPVDGIWLDYHHSHANWERAQPLLPDTCFCDRCILRFQKDTGTVLPTESIEARAGRILREHRESWAQWRCDVFTDWVREYRAILDRTRPHALLGTFHCPWTEADFEGALKAKLAIDLKAQARYLHVFSPMPYHARFGHASDPAWISSQIHWLGRHLGLRGSPEERIKIWPIIQISDWGESVPVSQVPEALDHGTTPPATGVMVFAWGSLRGQAAKVEALGRFYRAIGE